MKRTRITVGILAALAVGVFAGNASALTWTHANTQSNDTVALYHFDEGVGTVAVDATGPHLPDSTDMNLDSASMWLAGDGWGAGVGSHVDTVGDASGPYGGVTGNPASGPRPVVLDDWSNGVTLSYWLQTSDAASATTHYPVRFDRKNRGEKNNIYLSYRPDWGRIDVVTHHMGATSIQSAGDIADGNLNVANLCDGQWHHVAIVYDPNGGVPVGRLYVDNVPIQVSDDQGTPIYTWDADGGVIDTAAGTVAVNYNNQVTASWDGDVDEIFLHKAALSDFGDGFLEGGPPPYPGDATSDGCVTVADLGILAGNYGTLSGMAWGDGDFNGDNCVTVADLGILAGNYGTCQAAVPEPMTMALLALGGVALLRRRRL